MSAQSLSRTAGQNSLAEVLTGLAVVAAAVVVLALVYTGKGGLSGYEIVAKIPQAAGLGIGTDVRISGIKVGSVSDLTLDPKDFLVTVHMDIQKGIEVPTDSSMQVTSSGFLGGQYISITPGGDAKNIAAGGRLENAQGSVDLMGLVARTIGGGTGQAAPAPQGAPPQQNAPVQKAPSP
jgi:phospholipid/cholesterol/gamma-HCH transport system substrate-binding protein